MEPKSQFVVESARKKAAPAVGVTAVEASPRTKHPVAGAHGGGGEDPIPSPLVAVSVVNDPGPAVVCPVLVGLIAPKVRVIAGVVVAVATDPETPLAVVTETLVTVPDKGVDHVVRPVGPPLVST